MSFPNNDPAWQAVANFLLSHLKPSDRVLAPDPFWWVIRTMSRYAETFVGPFQTYDWIVIHKGEMHLLQPGFLASFLPDVSPLFANEVFVVFAKEHTGKPSISAQDPHLRAFFERRSGIVGYAGTVPRRRNALASRRVETDPSNWFVSDVKLDRVLTFLDGKLRPGTVPAVFSTPQIASGEIPADPSLMIMALSARIAALESQLDPHRFATVPSGDRAAMNRPIANVRSMLEDVKARGFTPKGLVDIGAHVGDWTRMALSVFPNLAFVLIEPQKDLAGQLLALMGERPDCHVISAGAGRAAGMAVQTIFDDPRGSSFLPTLEAAVSGRQRQTPIVSVDDLFSADGQCAGFPPDLVKIDVQGYEMEVLFGAEVLFGRTELFIIETSLFEFMPKQPLAREVISFMASRGYEIYDIAEYGRRPYDAAVGQIDFAFAKRSGVLRWSNAW